MKATTVDISKLGPATDIPTASRLLGISRSYGFQLAKQGKFPARVIEVGSRLRVVTASLLELLEVSEEQAA